MREEAMPSSPRPPRLIGLATAAAVAAVVAVIAAPASAATSTTVVGAGSGRCLTVTGGSATAGAGVELWDCNDQSGQQWTTNAGGGTGSGHTGQVSDTNIAYVGRWDTSSTVATAHWAGAYLQTAFTGTSVKVRTRNAVSFYASIDGGSYVSHAGVSGTVNLTSRPLTAGTHTLRVEYASGDLAFEGLVLDSGAHTVTPSVPSGLLEFVGDSITAGAKDPRGALDAYGWKTGEQLHLRHTQIARAGYCLVAASGCVGQATQFFETDSTGAVPWDFSRYQASAVIINLGTNDLGHSVSNAQFQSAYTSFLANIRAKYPNAAIFVMETFKQWYVSQTKAAVAARNSAGDAKVYYVDTTGWLTSSDYVDGTHPTARGHTIIANHLAPIIAAKI
ncbi:GDSL-type esterase/lipase family protein [Actinocrinis sp.]|uniref:GDSL-type esterase/lipase family protein n=1 Tax=Actinocrinis sp. TaxID=1920516 RepID=UPI002BD68FA7|nr:GDSL-type esterase/lipase family protein [Actinocrinis sp.]HXR73127.1 GDSL-type esterase/lipase family protein [Actinocrinis sp.]